VAQFGVGDIALIALLAAVLVLPGLTICLIAGLPRWTAVAAAPLITYGLTAVAGPLTATLGLSWGPAALLGATILAAAAVLLVRRAWSAWQLRRSPSPDASARSSGTTATAAAAEKASTGEAEGPWPRPRRAGLVIAGGIVLGTLLGIYVALNAMGKLDAINQDWDAVFHANAVRFILSTGDADPSSLRAVNDAVDASFFYPNTFHALTAVVGQLSGASIPALLGAQSVLFAGITGLGLAALIWQHTRRVAFAAVVPILLAMFAAFPIDVLGRGPLLPYAAGIALVPAFLLLFGYALRTKQPGVLLVGALAAAGLLGLHPSAALTAAIFTLAFVVARWIADRDLVRQDLWPVLTVVAMTVVIAPRFVLATLGAGGAAAEARVNWAAVESPGQAVGDLLFLNHAAFYPQYWLVLLVFLGALGIKRIRRLWWWLGASSVFVGLFVLAAAYDSPLTEQLTLPWWNDRWRLAAIVTLGMAVLAAHGLVVSAEPIVAGARRFKPLDRFPVRRLMGASVIALMLAVGVLSEGFYASSNAARMSLSFGDGPNLSTAEQRAMRALAEMAGPDDRVMNDPGDGSAWMWALVDVRPMFGHVVNPPAIPALSPERQLLLSSFSCLDSDPALRALVEEFNITYVFLGRGFLRSYFTRIPGLQGLNGVDSLEQVYSEDGNRIYRVDLAPLQDPSPSSEICDTTRS